MSNIIITRTIIMGAGPAALTASIYLSRAKINHILISGPLKGGQLVFSPEIENFPGFKLISGYDLIKAIEDQVKSLSIAKIKHDTIKEVDFSSTPYKLIGENATYKAPSIIIATGASSNRLGLTYEEELIGKGISYCAPCDGYFYKNQDVAVVGGGNTAVEEAIYLSNIAKNVTLIHRKNVLTSEKILQERIFKAKNINFIWNSTVIALKHNPSGLNSIEIRNNEDNTITELSVNALFIAIGSSPNTQFLKNQIELDNNGYIITNKATQTSLPGVFAAGDVQDPQHKQAIIGAGSGAKAALEVIKYLMNK